MPDIFQTLRLSTWRRYARIGLFLAKWLMRLLSASAEVYFRHNFGRRYLRFIFMAGALYIFCAALAPRSSYASTVFLAGLVGLSVYQSVKVFTRHGQGAPHIYSLYAGDSWPCWQRWGVQQTAVQRYAEPALCFLVSLPVSAFDPFLGLWLKVSAAALFIKEQLACSAGLRRILDALDARLEAQSLNAGVSRHQQAPSRGPQRLHRPRRPWHGPHLHP